MTDEEQQVGDLEDAIELAETGRCGLPDCENPLPPPPVDAEGKRKGGRPPAYCCKAHADAASRARRLAQTSAITDPLAEVRRIVDGFDPAARSLLRSLAEIRDGFAQAETAALGRVTSADAEAVAARDETAAASREAEHARTARAKAVAAAREDRQARLAAERQAERAERRAEQVREQAWQQVAEHERAKGAAEAAQLAAQAASDERAAQLRAARAEQDELRMVLRDTRQRLADAEAALTEAKSERAALAGRLDVEAHRLADAARDRDVTREELRRTGEELRAGREALQSAQLAAADEHTARLLAEAKSETLGEQLATAHSAVAEVNGRIDRLLSARHAPVDSENTPQEGPKLPKSSRAAK